ncbi:ABC transporter substrate-binding protein [Desulfosoma caldarium]|uniref:Iron complex transport system substrate-binding protein n=1 Tax=Desulfosoma caldarium TaxID=610254 RepID=A0A3N1VK58_9BACT|nr:helical backbone metal receptor [Desulfosoma caldarium]ROR03196.1 iron complex transport system substrate-binding protein [Desulfosoma caldarium]
MRVLSIAPTPTETLAALGALDLLIGVSEDCDFPEDVRRMPTYGSWASPDLHAICRDRPDLVCTFGRHQEEMALWLRDRGLSVFHSDPATVDEALRDMARLAQELKRPLKGTGLVERLSRRLSKIDAQTERIPPDARPKIFRLMQWNPLITVGPGAFQYDVIERAGGRNFLGRDADPYVKVSHEKVVAWNPHIVFLCEPSLAFLLRQDSRWSSCTAVREGFVRVFPCGLTCRAGPRIVDMTEQLHRMVWDWFDRKGVPYTEEGAF